MEFDDPTRSADPLTMLARQDLDPFSVSELEARIAALEAEIVRTRVKAAAAASHRTNAHTLFRN